MSTTKKQYFEEVRAKLKDKFKYSNDHEIPKIIKIIVHRRLGEAVSNSKLIQQTGEQFVAIFGKKPLFTRAKKSISNFKLREGQVIGAKVTLRGDRMYDFLSKFLHIILPKIRDFRGVSTKSFDGRGSYSLGLKEDLIFPEVDYNKVDKPRGFDVTIATTAKTDEEAQYLLALLGMPFSSNVLGEASASESQKKMEEVKNG